VKVYVYIEPTSATDMTPVTKVYTRKAAIRAARAAVPPMREDFRTDADALLDFMAVQWAVECEVIE